MKNFKTFQLALQFYKEAKALSMLRAPLKDQFERASLSILLNLAEGAGRSTSKERRRFYTISMGSLREVQALLLILNQNKLYESADCLGAHIYKLIQNPGAVPVS